MLDILPFEKHARQVCANRHLIGIRRPMRDPAEVPFPDVCIRRGTRGMSL